MPGPRTPPKRPNRNTTFRSHSLQIRNDDRIVMTRSMATIATPIDAGFIIGLRNASWPQCSRCRLATSATVIQRRAQPVLHLGPGHSRSRAQLPLGSSTLAGGSRGSGWNHSAPGSIGSWAAYAHASPVSENGKAGHILTSISIFSGRAGVAGEAPASDVLRRVKRLIWFALVGCVGLIAALETSQRVLPDLSGGLALSIILVASWAILVQITLYLRTEAVRRRAEAEAARLEGARMTASAMQDRI